MIRFAVVSLLFLIVSAPVQAQKTIKGIISDAKTTETLPAANISIEGTYRGTISNRDGKYTLSIPDSLLPATIVVRYIGYASQKRVITTGGNEEQSFRLEPAITQLGEIIVTDEDPAIRIMREVIRRKQEWRKELQSYRAEAYTRQTLSNDTSIVMITETISEAFWEKGKGHREIIKSRKQTANIQAADNFAGVSYLPNFYDDNIDIAGFKMVGVTHPDALKFYHFKLIGQSKLDNKTVFKIKVSPARKLQPLFEGTIYVLDEDYALLEVSLKPNDVVKFPAPVKDFNLEYEQQFNNFGKAFWLPVDMRIEGDVKIKMVGLEFPRIQFRQLARISDYQVNIPVPDSLFSKNRTFTVDSTTIKNDSLFVNRLATVPLSDREQAAYANLDSTQTLEKAFKPSGFLARFIEDDEEGGKNSGSGRGLDVSFINKIPGSFSPQLRFNRVDELYAGLKYSIHPVSRLKLEGFSGYSTGYKAWGYGGGADYTLFRGKGWRAVTGASYHDETVPRYQSQIYVPAFTLLSNLVGRPDYYDYYRSRGFKMFGKVQHYRSGLSAKLGFSSEDHHSLQANTAYDILGRHNSPQPNPAIGDGHLNAVTLVTGYNLDDSYNFGVTGLKKIKIKVERSAPWLHSDFNYTRYQLGIDWDFKTFYQRRLLPNTLDVKLSAGTYTGTLPLQKYGIADVALNLLSPFGTLKTVRNRPYDGASYVSFVAEHNFRTVPFEILGLSPLVDRSIGLILFGGVARTWVPGYAYTRHPDTMFKTTEGMHTEIGASLNSIFGLFRIDFAQRLDEPAFLVNISVARIF